MSSANKEGSLNALIQSEEGENGVQVTFLADGLMLFTVADPASKTYASAEALELPLSPGEWTVVRLAARGLSNEEIASNRSCSSRTVANQLGSAYRKLGVSGRRELRARLLDHGTGLANALSIAEEL